MKKKSVKANPKKLSVEIEAKKSYEKDFCRWIRRQSSLLKKQDFSSLDLENLIEEIETLGRSERRSLKSHLIVLLQHLLKIRAQPEKRTKSWDQSIANATRQIRLILKDSPSLKREVPEMIKEIYPYARQDAILETRKKGSAFPLECPFSIEEILARIA